ncbi:MAG: hypothetical protein JSR89_04225 [Proteobacteria bacterium]|nr:hypothetical protein [Pseudomonadota bacterium]
MSSFNPSDWFWIVGGDASKAWSSAAAAYVTSYDEERVTHIANEVELYDVLARCGLSSRAPSRSFTLSEVRDALAKIDAGLVGSRVTADELAEAAGMIGFFLPNMAA